VMTSVFANALIGFLMKQLANTELSGRDYCCGGVVAMMP
jgi:hypothetical protein